MGWIKLIEKTIALPLNVARDVITFGGIFENKSKPNTLTNLKKIGEEIDKIIEED